MDFLLGCHGQGRGVCDWVLCCPQSTETLNEMEDLRNKGVREAGIKSVYFHTI